jgi:carboxyl-terminal processing protease
MQTLAICIKRNKLIRHFLYIRPAEKRTMKKILFVTIILTVIVASNGHAQMPDSVKNYIDTAITIMKTRSLFAKDLPWVQITDSAYYKAKDANSYKAAFPALAFAFEQLKDYHGMLQAEGGSYRYPPPINFDSALSKGIKKEFLKGNRIVTALLDGGVGYIRVPSMNVFSQADIDKKANMLRDSLCVLLAKKPKRLIVDLRMNSGGNSAPMITGISPLLTNSILGYGVDRNGMILSPTRLKNGVVVDEKGNKMVNIHNHCKAPKNIPIAVLTGPSTVSSGEILTVFLRQQKNVKVFGEPTAGFCNATEGFLFANNEGYLLLSVNKIADAKKNVCHEMLVRPDVYVKSDDNYENLLQDPTVVKALEWLQR